jgi:endonuclease III
MAKSKTGLATQMDLAEKLGPLAQRHAHRITVHKSVIREYFRVMLKAYKERTGRFERIHHLTDGPQHKYVPGQDRDDAAQDVMFDAKICPPKMKVGSLEHLVYFFLVTPTDHLQDSDKLYANHIRIYADHPWVYSKEVLKLTKDELAALFKKYRVGIHNENARFFLNNAKTLFEDFGGDPVKIFRSAGASVDNVLAWREKREKETGRNPLLGFEHKIASLYLLYLAEFGALPMPKDAFAVDVHVIFQLYQVGGFTLHERMDNMMIAQILREVICDIFEEEQFSKVDGANVTWLNGSKGCKSCSSNAAAQYLCPVWGMCKGRYATDNYHHNGSVDPADPLFPKGGIRPEFGIPRTIRKRPEKKGRGAIIIEHLTTLFDEEFAEKAALAAKQSKRTRKVIPITDAKKLH